LAHGPQGGRSGTPKTPSFCCTGAEFTNIGPPRAPTGRLRAPKGPQRRPHFAAQAQCFSTWIPRRPQRVPQAALILLHRRSVFAHGTSKGTHRTPKEPQGPPIYIYIYIYICLRGGLRSLRGSRAPQDAPARSFCCTGAVFWHITLILLHRCSVLAHGPQGGRRGPPKTPSFCCTGAVFSNIGPPRAPTGRLRAPKGPQRRPHFAAQAQCFRT